MPQPYFFAGTSGVSDIFKRILLDSMVVNANFLFANFLGLPKSFQGFYNKSSRLVEIVNAAAIFLRGNVGRFRYFQEDSAGFYGDKCKFSIHKLCRTAKFIPGVI